MRVPGSRVCDRVEGVPDPSLDPDLERVGLVDLGDRAMDVDDGLVPRRVPALRCVLDEVVADRHHDVGPVEAEVRVVAHHESDRAERVRMVVGEDALPEERGGDGEVQTLGETDERVHRAVASNTGSREDHRGRRGFQDLRRPADLRFRRCRIDRHVDTQRHALRLLLGDVFRQDQEGRTGTLGPRLLERLAHHLRYRFVDGDHAAPLRDRAEQFHEVEGLVGLLVEPVEPGLRGDGHERMRVEVGVRDPEHQVDRARAERGQAHARMSRERAVGVRHERRAAFVTRRDEADRRVRDRIDHVEVLFARQPEDVLDALVLEALDEQAGNGLCAVRGFHLPLRLPPSPGVTLGRWSSARW